MLNMAEFLSRGDWGNVKKRDLEIERQCINVLLRQCNNNCRGNVLII